MCVIAIYNGKREQEKNLRQMAIDNPDGTGVVYYVDKVPFYKKGLEIKEVLELSRTLPFPFAFHFRWTTVGKDKLLTHPYEVSRESALKMEGSAETLLMHNGHWGDWNEKVLEHALGTGINPPDGDWSDSRAMAYLGGVVGINALKMLSGQKIAIFQRNMKIRLLGAGWENEKGVAYSNKNWEHKTYTYTHGTDWNRGEWDYVNKKWVPKKEGAINQQTSDTPKETEKTEPKQDNIKVYTEAEWAEITGNLEKMKRAKK